MHGKSGKKCSKKCPITIWSPWGKAKFSKCSTKSSKMSNIPTWKIKRWTFSCCSCAWILGKAQFSHSLGPQLTKWSSNGKQKLRQTRILPATTKAALLDQLTYSTSGLHSEKTYQFNLKYVFGNTVNKCETTASSQDTSVFRKFFGDDPAKIKFNPNNIRDTLQDKLSDHFFKALFGQAAHCEKTALQNFVDPNTCKKLRAEVLNFMEADLDRGSCDTHEFGAMNLPDAPPPRLSTVSMDSSIE